MNVGRLFGADDIALQHCHTVVPQLLQSDNHSMESPWTS
jgi:hypothetical protein